MIEMLLLWAYITLKKSPGGGGVEKDKSRKGGWNYLADKYTAQGLLLVQPSRKASSAIVNFSLEPFRQDVRVVSDTQVTFKAYKPRLIH